jgi:hypothetical protein
MSFATGLHLYVKTVKKLSLIWLISLLLGHKIASLMQCVESIIDRLSLDNSLDISLISEAVLISCPLIVTMLLYLYA